MRSRLTYANVMATLAFFLALGGGALAVSKIGSKEIQNGSIKSADLRNHRAVGNRDVKPNGIRGRAIAEGSLDASKFARIVGDEGPDCDPASGSVFVTCANASLRLLHILEGLDLRNGQ